MSGDMQPISPTRFAAALKDLSGGALHLKALEICNSMAKLMYTNDQLRPFADAADQDCIDAIRENEAVIGRMAHRMALLSAEAEHRGMDGLAPDPVAAVHLANGGPPPATVADAQDAAAAGCHLAWSDGTFQTGTVRNGQFRLESQRGRPDEPEESPIRPNEQRRDAMQGTLQRRPSGDEDSTGSFTDGGLTL